MNQDEASGRGRVVAVYDDRCGFCSRTARLFARLDRRGRIEFLGASKAPPSLRQLSGIDFDREMVVFRGERVFGGYDAIRELVYELPLGGLFGWKMGWPPVRWLGRRIYRLVARHRGGDACARH